MAKVHIERKSDIRMVRAEKQDYEKLTRFFTDTMWQGKADVPGLFSWKYDRNPQGKTLALIGVNDNSEIVASSMFMPWRLKAKTGELGACQWVDLFVKLEYRGTPFASEGLQEALRISRSQASPICFAFPNSNSVPVHKKNNGIHLGSIYRHTKPLDVAYLLERKIKNPAVVRLLCPVLNFVMRLISKEIYCGNKAGFSFELVERCGQEFDALWQRFNAASNNKIMSIKTSGYLNWKYIDSPGKNRKIYAARKNGALAGFAVLESTPEIGYIVDILAESDETLDYLIARSILAFRKEGKSSVVFVALENNAYIDNFNRFGFVKRPEEKHFYIYLDEAMQDKDYFTDSRNWFVTIGDCDIDRM